MMIGTDAYYVYRNADERRNGDDGDDCDDIGNFDSDNDDVDDDDIANYKKLSV